jgi:GR25 family glycosyltransferase involved in LPS biosynthesis
MSNINDGFTFYKGLDSFGYDSVCVGKLPIDELKKICNSSNNYIGFNTFGYIKHFICDINKLKTVSSLNGPTDGIYIHDEKFKKMKKDTVKSYTYFEDYDFYPRQDSSGNDAYQLDQNMTLQEMKLEVDNSDNAGFNTLGFVKKTICDPSKFKTLNTTQYFQGLYVKKRKFRVKLLCNWTSCEGLCNEWNKMSKGNYTWNDIEVTWTNDNIDFFIIVNKPPPNEHYIAERTIVFQMEPWCYDPNQKWGVKTWGQWAKPDETLFLQVRPHTKYLNNTFWQLDTTYTQFKTLFNINKTQIISSICSSKYFDPGHIKRIDFLKFIESKNDELVQVHIYNHDNDQNFKNYKGRHTPNKDAGMMPYKYYFMPENNEEYNFITEKIWEPLLCECLCFYWGCPNITDWFDPRSYILLDMNDFEKSFNIIRDAIINDEWSKRLDVIRREKQKVLDYYNFFPTVERIIKQEFKFNYKPTDDEIIYHKYFKDIINIGQNISKVCFIHSCCVENDTTILHQLLTKIIDTKAIDSFDYIYIVNIGCNIDNIKNSKVKVINYSSNLKLFEKPTINLLNVFSKFNDCKILYLHTKGVSYKGTNNNVNDWTNYMLYNLLDNHKLCLDLLDIYDTVGCNYNEKPYRHYSGNFWYTDSKYARTLYQITSNDRHSCEWYILGNNNVKMYVLNNSNVDHYMTSYPPERYVNALSDTYSKFYNFDSNNISIKCVNLVRRPDRKETMITIFKENDLFNYCDFIEAVDGKYLKVTEELKALFKGNDFGAKPGVIGCALSHFKIWTNLVMDNVYDKYLVFEDDIEICNNFLFKFNYILDLAKNLDWDIIYFGYSTRVDKKYNDKKIEISNYDLVGNIGGTFGYLVNKSGANKFLSFIDKNGIKHGIDYLMFRYYKEMNLKQYQVTNPLVMSDCVRCNKPADSDIQYDHVGLF